MKVRSKVGTALAAGLVLSTSLATGAQAAPKATVVLAAHAYLSPDFAVSRGSVALLVCGQVTRVPADGTEQSLPVPGCTSRLDPRGGVAFSRDGASYGEAQSAHWSRVSPPFQVYSTITIRDTANGGVTSVADVAPVEAASNPDASATYGTTSQDPCVRDALGPAASYHGVLGSSLSAIAAGKRDWYVADRDGNTVYRLDSSGALSVVAVLPPVKVKVSAALAASSGWPSCMVGRALAYEPAPKEVEVGADGTLYVAGRPSLATQGYAPRSVIYKINPTSGKVTRLRSYAGPVDLAAGTRGRLFVARLAAGKISVIKHGRSRTYARLAQLLSVETDEHGRLYAAQDRRSATEPPDVVRFP